MSTKVCSLLHSAPNRNNNSRNLLPLICYSQAADIIDEIFRDKLRSEKQRFVSSTAHSDSDSSDDERLNNYVQNHRVSLPLLDIDDISADSDEIEEEFQSLYTQTAAQDSDTNLSDNWMFKRRGEDGTSSSVVSATSPVGMLVPSPTEDIRTQIGDRNADEIESDLSETGSDLDDSLDDDDDNEKDRLNVTIDVPHVLVESKTLIGGKNEMTSFDHSRLFDLLEPGSLVSEQSLTGQSPVISEAKNELLLLDAANKTTENVNMERRQESSNRVEAVNDLLDFGPTAQPR